MFFKHKKLIKSSKKLKTKDCSKAIVIAKILIAKYEQLKLLYFQETKEKSNK